MSVWDGEDGRMEPPEEKLRRQADLAAWAADAEAERAALLATPEAALCALGIVKSDILTRARALRAHSEQTQA